MALWRHFIRVYMWQTCIFWTCDCYKTRTEWKINSLIRRKKNRDILRYEFRIAIPYKFFVYCDIPIYRYIVTPLESTRGLALRPKAQVHYCDHALSSVRLSVVNFSHFRLLLRNHWTEFNETWQEARTQRPLPSLCFSGRSKKQNGRHGLWLAETFSTSPLKPLNGIQWNLTGSKISTSSSQFVLFGPIEKTRWPPWPLIGWDIFDFFPETTERNSVKLDRKQDLNVLYQVCVFQVDWKNKMAALASDWLRHFRLLLWNRWTEFNKTWQEARSQRPLQSLCFSGWSVNKNIRLCWFLKKVAYCTQVHDMWPFGLFRVGVSRYRKNVLRYFFTVLRYIAIRCFHDIFIEIQLRWLIPLVQFSKKLWSDTPYFLYK